jgi:hypothetical protein
VVEHSDKAVIVFDFDNDPVVDFDPTQSSATAGAYECREGYFYIGAKRESEFLGTLVHEPSGLASLL